MNIILFTKRLQKPLTIPLSQPCCYLPVLASFVLICSGLFFGGFWLGQSGERQVETSELVQEWNDELEQQRQVVEQTKSQAKNQLTALTQRVGELQAHVLRLDALGQRLTHIAQLDEGEFDFDVRPAQGGPETQSIEPAVPQLSLLLKDMDQLANQLEDRGQQLVALESMMLHSNLEDQVLPGGRPILKGWLSSYYGKRTDPFTGKQEHHQGIDFAGKLGSDVIVAAAGVVVSSGRRYGYGNLVEVDHGNGYVTRYGHNKENLVSVGDKVEKGQKVALMGSSGRSTGPHVHFEVLYNGRHVNPAKYINSN